MYLIHFMFEVDSLIQCKVCITIKLCIFQVIIHPTKFPKDNFTLNKTINFKHKVDKYESMMNHIQGTTKLLQTNKWTLSQCREILDILIEDIESHSEEPGYDLYNCSLGKEYIGRDSNKVSHKDFENGVCKIQQGRFNDLTDDEKMACKSLRVDENAGNQDFRIDENALSFQERVAKRLKLKSDGSVQWHNANFILRSVAEVERLWSTADRVLDGKRNRTSPLLFEAFS